MLSWARGIWVGLAGGAGAGGVLSWVLNKWVFAPLAARRVTLWAITTVTFAASLVIGGVLLAAGGTSTRIYRQPHYSSVSFLGMQLTTQQLVITGLSVVAMIALHTLLRYTRLGEEMRATAANPELARTCGIQTARVTSIAWMISGLLRGAAGVSAIKPLCVPGMRAGA
jgi:neutral amino acid transport system permease protein